MTTATRLELREELTLTGTIAYDPATQLLELIDEEAGDVEVLSISLDAYGHTAPPRHVYVYVKDWSEHRGLAHALERVGVARVVDTVTVGPFAEQAHLMEVTL